MMHKSPVFLTAMMIAAAGFLAGCKKQGAADGAIHVSGNIEVIETQVSFKIPGRVMERAVDEGDPVKTGQEVARLDSQDLMQQQAQRKAEVEAAQAALQELENGSRVEEIARAKAALDASEADVERLKSDDVRQKALYDRQVISAREYEASHAALESAEARAREAGQTYILYKKGPRSETIEQARARLEQARQALAVATTQLGYASLVSPLSGVVLTKNVEPGEMVAAGTPVVTVGDIHSVYLRAYVDETELGRVKLGQKVRITTDMPGKAYDGKVTFISPESEFTPKTIQTEKERVKLVYRVKIDIPNPNEELKPGMPADGVIQTEDAR